MESKEVGNKVSTSSCQLNDKKLIDTVQIWRVEDNTFRNYATGLAAFTIDEYLYLMHFWMDRYGFSFFVVFRLFIIQCWFYTDDTISIIMIKSTSTLYLHFHIKRSN